MISTPRPPLNRAAALNEFRWAAERAMAPRIRPISQFAEEEIVLPSGPYEGLLFQQDRQPCSRLWFAEIESRRWNRHVFTGPQQFGKTLLASLIPLLFHLFEIGERVIFGLPNMEMAGDKWRDEILPVIEQTRYRDMLPAHGGGSRGGKVESIRFRHGRTLKFMSGGGSDKRRASYTSRVLIVTEIDDLDKSSEASDEADKLKQMEGRTRAFGDRKAIYLECTVSTETGRTWQEYTSSTRSRITLRCPKCRAWVTPEREHLRGWQEAASEFEAQQHGRFFCSACNQDWDETDRAAANRSGVLVHQDQYVDQAGEIQGPPPRTNTLGFRCSAVNNTFISAGNAALQEWKGSREENEENAERELCQWLWAIPHTPTQHAITPLTYHGLATRITKRRAKEVPADAEFVVVSADCGKWLIHWLAIAFSPGATPHLVDFGRVEVPSASLPVENALINALSQLDDELQQGWFREGTGEVVQPRLNTVDCRFLKDEVVAFCRQHPQTWLATQGFGEGRKRSKGYKKPKEVKKEILEIGVEYHLELDAARGATVMSVNADYWKTHLHERLATPLVDQDGKPNPGAMTFHHALPRDMMSLFKHLTAERKVRTVLPGIGQVDVWEVIRRANHWLDDAYNACAAGHYLGARLIETEEAPVPPDAGMQIETPTLPDGRKYFVNER
jgi:phage terminase large subunit GpA-like protein